ncbi:hypothetical protein K435DRAFT_879874 [Dendrothele bispora CBS 962.96]|uniref:Uncharacterized protein n=1 Tax=Dendrothele bispora (strain CBS 962.96) TaxID=1314807 RepID=A0A4S8KKD8_DENBC|nr:hypothetical protein K435DRAFT_879874 [Dendrothele bispora CBS 962.96]
MEIDFLEPDVEPRHQVCTSTTPTITKQNILKTITPPSVHCPVSKLGPNVKLADPDTILNLGEQCRRFGKALGFRNLAGLDYKDHIVGLRCLAATTVEDIPESLLARLHQNDLKKEFSRLVSLVEHPSTLLVVPEDPYMPNTWEFYENPGQ